MTAEREAPRIPAANDTGAPPNSLPPAAIGEPHLPRPTVWPAILASGASLFLWGFITSYAVSIAGAILFVVAAAGWAQQIRIEVRERPDGTQ